MPPELEAFDHIHVYVANRVQAEAWYGEILGFRRIRELEFGAADGAPLTLQNSSGTIHVALFEGPIQPCRSTVALRACAKEYKAWQQHLRDRWSVVEEHHGVSVSLYFNDPDGNPYEITTYGTSGEP